MPDEPIRADDKIERTENNYYPMVSASTQETTRKIDDESNKVATDDKRDTNYQYENPAIRDRELLVGVSETSGLTGEKEFCDKSLSKPSVLQSIELMENVVQTASLAKPSENVKSTDSEVSKATVTTAQALKRRLSVPLHKDSVSETIESDEQPKTKLTEHEKVASVSRKPKMTEVTEKQLTDLQLQVSNENTSIVQNADKFEITFSELMENVVNEKELDLLCEDMSDQYDVFEHSVRSFDSSVDLLDDPLPPEECPKILSLSDKVSSKKVSNSLFEEPTCDFNSSLCNPAEVELQVGCQ